MKTIKVIDLLNKMANGEELPKKIRVPEEVLIRELENSEIVHKDAVEMVVYEYNESLKEYYSRSRCNGLDATRYLNKEVEIIEDKENGEIAKIYNNGQIIIITGIIDSYPISFNYE